MEFTLLGAALIAVGALYTGIRWEAVRANAADCVRDHWDRAIAAAVTGVFTGRVVAMLLDGVNPFSQDLLIVRAGVDTVAATVAAVATVAWLGRRELAVALDGLAAAALFGLAGWHAGCLVRGACLGTTTAAPWAVSQTPGGALRHPVEIYAALLLLVAAVALLWWRTSRAPGPFVPAATALGVAGAVRLATEPLRLSLSGGPVGWYLAAALLGLIGTGVLQRRVSVAASGEATG